MLRRTATVVPLIALALLGSGCGTLRNQSEPGTMFNPSGATPYRPYGGVRECGSELVGETRMVVGLPADDSLRDVDSLTASAYAAGVVFVDLPLSLVGDTLMLPFDVTKTIQGRGEPPEGGWPLLNARRGAGAKLPDPNPAPADGGEPGNALYRLKSGSSDHWIGSTFEAESKAPSNP